MILINCGVKYVSVARSQKKYLQEHWSGSKNFLKKSHHQVENKWPALYTRHTLHRKIREVLPCNSQVQSIEEALSEWGVNVLTLVCGQTIRQTTWDQRILKIIERMAECRCPQRVPKCLEFHARIPVLFCTSPLPCFSWDMLLHFVIQTFLYKLYDYQLSYYKLCYCHEASQYGQVIKVQKHIPQFTLET